jgi:hypothetical protein
MGGIYSTDLLSSPDAFPHILLLDSFGEDVSMTPEPGMLLRQFDVPYGHEVKVSVEVAGLTFGQVGRAHATRFGGLRFFVSDFDETTAEVQPMEWWAELQQGQQ